MKLPENDYQILKLTDDFYNTYTDPPFKEILKKKDRAYTCLLFQTHYGYFICIPFRSEISHKYSFRFKNSIRSQKHRSGIDYSKMVIISDLKFVDSKNATIDKDEYNETMQNIETIKRRALDFLEEYIGCIKGTDELDKAEFNRRYQYSPLRYFHKEMGLPEKLGVETK